MKNVSRRILASWCRTMRTHSAHAPSKPSVDLHRCGNNFASGSTIGLLPRALHNQQPNQLFQHRPHLITAQQLSQPIHLQHLKSLRRPRGPRHLTPSRAKRDPSSHSSSIIGALVSLCAAAAILGFLLVKAYRRVRARNISEILTAHEETSEESL